MGLGKTLWSYGIDLKKRIISQQLQLLQKTFLENQNFFLKDFSSVRKREKKALGARLVSCHARSGIFGVWALSSLPFVYEISAGESTVRQPRKTFFFSPSNAHTHTHGIESECAPKHTLRAWDSVKSLRIGAKVCFWVITCLIADQNGHTYIPQHFCCYTFSL